MNKEILIEYTKQAGLETGVLSAYYNLSGSVDTVDPEDRMGFYKLTSGATNTLDTYVVYNQLYDTGSQLYDTNGDGPLIAVGNYPAVINSTSSSLTGSGYFDGKSSLKSARRVTGDAWTCFLDFSGSFGSHDNGKLSQVLLSTMTGIDCPSGFNVGINGSNRLYYEYITGVEGSNTHRRTETLANHTKKLNLISVSKSPSILEVSLHKPNESTVSIKSPLNNFSESEELFWGGFAHGGAYGHFYTGLSGYVNTIALFSDHVSEVGRNKIAEGFFLDSFTNGGLVTGERFTKEVTGVDIQLIQEGWTNTGYELVPSGSHKNEAGETISTYALSGVLGRNYREIMVDLTGQNDIRSITGYHTDNSAIRKDSYVSDLDAVPGQIKFVEALAVGELLEIYSHSKYLNTINHTAETEYFFETVQNTDGLSFDVKGRQLKNDNLSFNSSDNQPFLQIFRNGIIEQEVSGLHSVSDIFNDIGGNLKEVGDRLGVYKGDYFINDNSAGADGTAGSSGRINNNRYVVVLNSQSDTIASDEFVLFDIVSGSSLTGDYAGSNVHFTGEYLDKDIYLNGRKLVSGHEYSQSSTGGKISYLLDASEIGADNKGELLFLPQASTSFTRVTGEGGGEDFDIDNVFFEQVWRNGIRQVPGLDYFRSPKDSLIGTGGASYTNDSFSFLSNESTLDVKVKDKIPARYGGGKVRRKVFSFDSDGKTNLFTTSS